MDTLLLLSLFPPFITCSTNGKGEKGEEKGRNIEGETEIVKENKRKEN